MNIYDIVFYLFSIITIVSAVIVVTSKNIVYSAFSLMFTFFGVAGFYVLLGADFLSIVQIVVYLGGILILLLFGVMLTNKITNVQIRTGSVQIIPAILGVGVLAGYLIHVLINTEWQSFSKQLPNNSTIGDLGHLLITDYVLIFELLAILLLIALVGAAMIARKEEN